MKVWKAAMGRSVDGMRAVNAGCLVPRIVELGKEPLTPEAQLQGGRILGGSTLQHLAPGLDWDLT